MVQAETYCSIPEKADRKAGTTSEQTGSGFANVFLFLQQTATPPLGIRLHPGEIAIFGLGKSECPEKQGRLITAMANIRIWFNIIPQIFQKGSYFSTSTNSNYWGLLLISF